MKITLKNLIGTFAFALIVIMLLVGLSYLFMPKNNQLQFGMEDVAANGILGEKPNTIDVLVIGDSEAYSSIIPMQLWQDHGFTTYVCATSAQYLSYSQKMLKQAFENQAPQLVIMETNAIYRDMKFEKSIIAQLEYYFSIFKYHDRWKSMSQNDFLGKVEYTWTDDLKGYFYNIYVKRANACNHMKPSDEIQPINTLNKMYIESMADFCNQNAATFLLVSTPSTVNWNSKKHNGIQQLANELGIEYIDLNVGETKVPINWEQDTRDAGDHLNHYGAVKTTTFLGEYLSHHYELPDNRKNPDYVKWNESLARYTEKIAG